MIATRKPRLRWRRQARERGLAGVGQGELGADLIYLGEPIASVRAVHYHLPDYGKWWWHAGGSGVPYRNMCRGPVNSLEEAQAAALAYVKGYLESNA